MSALVPMTSSQQGGQQCIICLEEASPERPLFTHQPRPILHPFHFDCINHWAETLRHQYQEPTCPLCRKRITVLDAAPHEDAAIPIARHNERAERHFPLLKSVAFNALSAAVIGAACGITGVAVGMGAAMVMAAKLTNDVATAVLFITYVLTRTSGAFLSVGTATLITTGTLETQAEAISQAAAVGLAAIVAEVNVELIFARLVLDNR